MYKKLIKNQENIVHDKITLFCLPFAGGGASAYNTWMKRMQNMICVCPIQLPGREERIMEQLYKDMNKMLDDLEQAVLNVVKGSYALWGHSMGGKIAYELEKRMENRGYTAKYLFVSGSRVPHIPEPNPIYYLSDEAFKEKLGRFEGTPKEILENKELLDFFLPMLRADFTMDETYYTKEIQKLNCSIYGFGGIDDKEADEKAIKKWQEYTNQNFLYKIFQGNHFFIKEHEDEILSIIEKCLKGKSCGV